MNVTKDTGWESILAEPIRDRHEREALRDQKREEAHRTRSRAVLAALVLLAVLGVTLMGYAIATAPEQPDPIHTGMLFAGIVIAGLATGDIAWRLR